MKYMVYSKLLNKPFDKVSDLEAAEAEYRTAHEEELKAKEEKRLRAEEVEKARQASEQIRVECSKKIREADDKYVSLLNAFVRDYGVYHNTRTSEIINIFNDLWRLF